MTALAALPVLFLSHGAGPAAIVDFTGQRLAEVDRNSPSADFMRSLSKVVDAHSPSPVRCLLVISAHWEEPVFTVDYQQGPATKLLYDYSGFPAETYAPHLTYPVPTDLQVADRVAELIRSAGLPCEKKSRGFDHGTFVPLKVAYPEARLPVVQLSLKASLSIPEHIRLGELLQPLRREGVLIIASGQITHSSEAARPGVKIDPRAVAFTDWMNTFLSSSNLDNYEEKKAQLSRIAVEAPHYTWAHGREEHFTPMAVAFGAAFGGAVPANTKAQRIYQEVTLGKLAVDSYLFSSCSGP